MLPLFSSDQVHHRYGPGTAGGGMLRGAASTALHTLLPGVSRSKRPLFARLMQAFIVLCLLLPLVWIITSPFHLARTAVKRSQPTDSAYLGDFEDDSNLVSAPDVSSRRHTNQRASDADDGGSGGAKQVQSQPSKHSIQSAGGKGGRKMMNNPLPLPGAHLKHLILVAGHAVYVGRDYSEASKEASWFLEDYQKVPGEAASFVEHIRLGILEAAQDPDAMLLFSGGQTRLAAGPRSEGLSYWVVAEAASWFNVSAGVRARTFTEEHARDSFENLLFSMCRFYELSGHYPDQVTVVSYTLKEQRFRQLHRAALQFPVSRFKFVGSPVPPDAVGAQQGEARTVAAFKRDPYGCQGELLDKRLRRDPFAVGPPHPSRCPELKGLLQYCQQELYPGPLPWATGGDHNA